MVVPWLWLACAVPSAEDTSQGVDSAAIDDSDVGGGDSGDDTDDTVPDCGPTGTWDCPVLVDSFPFLHAGDTASSLVDEVDAYDCAPGTNESGAEVVYRLDVDAPGAVTVHVQDGTGVDIDVHLLDAPRGGGCLTRDDTDLVWLVEAGTYWVAADTYVSGSGPQDGAYTVTIDFQPLPTGDCAFSSRDLRMYWDDCAPGMACDDSGADVRLHTPSAGPVVKEAHLVTVADDFDGGWPVSFTDGIAAHYALSQAATGYDMDRSEPWAPSGEGGSEYGQGATGSPLPVADESWYVNMYWRDKPAGGTRMLVWNPANGRMVVASGGYETGPGANDALGGATEEIHHALGTGHRDVLVMGFAADPSLPLGPVRCD